MAVMPCLNFMRTVGLGKINYIHRKQLGDARNSSDLIAQLYLTERTVVLKKVKFYSNGISKSRPQGSASVEQELQMLRTLSSPYIVPIYDAWHEDNHLVFELEHIVGAISLRAAIGEQKITGQQFSLERTHNWLFQLAKGIAYLHELKLGHGNLRPEKILLSKDGSRLKLTGLGVRSLLDAGRLKDSKLLPYLAPEVVLDNGAERNLLLADIWAFGVIAYELAVLELPFQGDYTRIYNTSRSVKPEKHEEVRSYSIELHDLIDWKLLLLDPASRSTISQILDDSFFHGAIPVRAEDHDSSNFVQEQLNKFRKQARELAAEKQLLTDKLADLEERLRVSSRNSLLRVKTLSLQLSSRGSICSSGSFDAMSAVALDKEDYYRAWPKKLADKFYHSHAAWNPVKVDRSDPYWLIKSLTKDNEVSGIVTCDSWNTPAEESLIPTSVLIFHRKGHVTALSSNNWRQKEQRQQGLLVGFNDFDEQYGFAFKTYICHVTYDPYGDDIYLVYNELNSYHYDIGYVNRGRDLQLADAGAAVQPTHIRILIERSQLCERRIQRLAFDGERKLLFASCPNKMRDVTCWLVTSSDNSGAQKTASLLFTIDCEKLGIVEPWDLAVYCSNNNNDQTLEIPLPKEASYLLALARESHAAKVEIFSTTPSRLAEIIENAKNGEETVTSVNATEIFQRSSHPPRLSADWAPAFCFDKFGNLLVTFCDKIKVYTFDSYSASKGIRMHCIWQSVELTEDNKGIDIISAAAVNPQTQNPAVFVARYNSEWVALLE